MAHTHRVALTETHTEKVAQREREMVSEGEEVTQSVRRWRDTDDGDREDVAQSMRR